MAKYKVGDWVTLKQLPKHQAHILEVQQQTCEAGITQTQYLTRIIKEELRHENRYLFPTQEIRLREMEIKGKIEEPE